MFPPGRFSTSMMQGFFFVIFLEITISPENFTVNNLKKGTLIRIFFIGNDYFTGKFKLKRVKKEEYSWVHLSFAFARAKVRVWVRINKSRKNFR